MVGLGMLLITKGYHDARYIDEEMTLATNQVGVLETVDDLDEFFEQTDESVFRSHIMNLRTIARSGSGLSQDNLIEILNTRLLSRNRLTELFASILVTLGLIGTIIGLVIMMNGLTEVLLNEGAGPTLIPALVDAETGPLQGLGVAFITTLIGAVLGGVILRVLTNIVDASVMEYTTHIAELTEVYVLPYLRSTQQQNAVQKSSHGANNNHFSEKVDS